jgi:phosphotransferase system  glucose/maltose/N-acetylglucosamine-specific IIC component
LDVPLGTYNLTVSASGMKDLKKEVVVGAGANDLGEIGMDPVDDWTWLIIVAVVAALAIVAVYFLFLKKKPEEPQPKEQKPAEKKPEAPKGKK